MTVQEAHEILHPDTTRAKIGEIEYYAGFNSERAIEAVNEACIVACKALEMQMKLKVWIECYNNEPRFKNATWSTNELVSVLEEFLVEENV